MLSVEADEDVLNMLGEKGFDPQFGARPLKRVMQKMILNELSKEILAGKINKDDVVGMLLDEQSGDIRFYNVSKVEIE